ncbi:MAG: DAK2 domain-containing protein, partial [Erysipelotrichaceae bacterium]
NAFMNGAKVAYKAVMKPVEGTILTVIRESSEEALMYLNNNPNITIDEYMDYLIERAKFSLKTTPDLLPILKEVGVVDSGGCGLLYILSGFNSALKGNVIALEKKTNTSSESNLAQVDNDEFGYCTEFIVKLSDFGMDHFKEDDMKKSLSRMGDSIVVVQDDDIFKVHVHTLKPGDALNMAQKYGEFIKLKIENMQLQHENIVSNETKDEVIEEQEYAIIAVASGDGIKDTFNSFNANYIISGGQTMNPSTIDFVEMIETTNAKKVIILPNNSNIILAANQAASQYEDGHVIVLPTKTIPQGLSACIVFEPGMDLDANLANMQEAIDNTHTGQVTYAIKDTSYNGLLIKENDYIGIKDKDIVTNGPDKMETICRLLDLLVSKDSEIVTIIKGEDGTDEEVEKIIAYIDEEFNIEVDMIDGGQPVYSFIFGVE